MLYTEHFDVISKRIIIVNRSNSHIPCDLYPMFGIYMRIEFLQINFQKKSRIAQRKVYDVDLQSIVR